MSIGIVLIGGGIGLAGIAIVFALILFAPARAVLEIDTARSIARVRVRPLWATAPETTLERRPGASRKSMLTRLVQRIGDLPRVAHAALIAPKLVAPVRQMLTDIAALKPSANRITVSLNAVHPLANALIELAAGLPESIRRGVEIRTRDGVGPDFAAHIEASAAPLTLWRIYRRFRTDANVREFLRRLSKETKARDKRARPPPAR